MNLYGYVGNDPLNVVDPFGLYANCASFAGDGNSQTCVEVPNLIGKEFDTLDAASKAAGDVLNRFSAQTGNEYGIAFILNENGTFPPPDALSACDVMIRNELEVCRKLFQVKNLKNGEHVLKGKHYYVDHIDEATDSSHFIIQDDGSLIIKDRYVNDVKAIRVPDGTNAGKCEHN